MNRLVKHKFKARSVTHDGKFFGSKLEFFYYQQLLLRQKAGEVLFFLRQVPLHLPGTKYVVDFLEFHSDGGVVFTEVKGFPTPLGQTKIKIAEEIYPIKINIVTKV